MNVGEVLHVHKESEPSEGVLGQETEEDVRLRLGTVRVFLQPLVSGVIAFNTDPANFFLFPHPNEAETMARRKRSIDPFAKFKLARVYIGIAERGREGGLSQGAEKLKAGVVRRLGEIDKFVTFDTVHIDRVADAGIE